MNTLILIAGLFLLFWFRKSIKGVARSVEIVVDETNEATKDSIQTYANEISINNASVRTSQMERIDDLSAIVTNKDIRSKLAKKETTQPVTDTVTEQS